MDISDFKKLEVKGKTPLKAIFKAKQFKRTMLFMGLGAIASAVWFYYTEGQHMGEISSDYWYRSGAIGAMFGVFISNSPCARGKC